MIEGNPEKSGAALGFLLAALGGGIVGCLAGWLFWNSLLLILRWLGAL